MAFLDIGTHSPCRPQYDTALVQRFARRATLPSLGLCHTATSCRQHHHAPNASMHLWPKNSTLATKTAQSQGDLHGLWIERCLLCRGPGCRSDGKRCRREEDQQRHHRHVSAKRKDTGQWTFQRKKKDPRKWWILMSALAFSDNFPTLEMAGRLRGFEARGSGPNQYSRHRAPTHGRFKRCRFRVAGGHFLGSFAAVLLHRGASPPRCLSWAQAAAVTHAPRRHMCLEAIVNMARSVRKRHGPKQHANCSPNDGATGCQA